MTLTLRARLGAMLFLEYFIWGAWYVTLATWLQNGLHLGGAQIGLAAGATSVGAMVAPFFVGLLADRFFATERVLAALHGLGALLLFAMARQTHFGPLYGLELAYCLVFMPTLALTNALAFRQMRAPELEFGPLRVLGTLGWIAAGLLVGGLAWEHSARTVELAGAASLAMAIYALTLPATPPLATGVPMSLGAVFPRETVALLGGRSMLVFALASLAICVPLQFYYAFTNLFLNERGVADAAGKMTGGQVSELACMLLIPWFFRRLGVKWMLLAGMGAWAVRYVLFAFGGLGSRSWMLWGGILLHGICYDFFFVTGQIYIDRRSPAALRAATQGLLTFLTYGVGMFAGAALSGAVVGRYTLAGGGHDWRAIWIVSALASALVLLVFALVFRDEGDTAVPAPLRAPFGRAADLS